MWAQFWLSKAKRAKELAQGSVEKYRGLLVNEDKSTALQTKWPELKQARIDLCAARNG
jgi:hypothetical protein